MDRLFGIKPECIVEKTGDNPRSRLWHYRYIDKPLERHTAKFPTSVPESEAKRELRQSGVTGIILWPPFLEEPPPIYGRCPFCKSAGIARERRPNGNDTCFRGHKYPSSDAIITKS